MINKIKTIKKAIDIFHVSKHSNNDNRYFVTVSPARSIWHKLIYFQKKFPFVAK